MVRDAEELPCRRHLTRAIEPEERTTELNAFRARCAADERAHRRDRDIVPGPAQRSRGAVRPATGPEACRERSADLRVILFQAPRPPT